MLVHCFSGLAGNWEDEIEVEGVVVEVEGVEDVVEVEVEVEVVGLLPRLLSEKIINVRTILPTL